MKRISRKQLRKLVEGALAEVYVEPARYKGEHMSIWNSLMDWRNGADDWVHADDMLEELTALGVDEATAGAILDAIEYDDDLQTAWDYLYGGDGLDIFVAPVPPELADKD